MIKGVKKMTKDEIKALLPMSDVLQALHIPMATSGKSLMCICPWHDDQHFGSCFVNHDWIYCHACHESGDIFKVIQTKLAYTFPQALEWAADLIGENVTFSHRDERLDIMLSHEDIEFLQIHNDPIYEYVGFVEYIEDKQKYEYETVYVSKGSDDIAGYAAKQIVEYNPLKTLCIEEPEIYKSVVDGAIHKMEQRYREILALMESTFGELGYMAVLPHFHHLRDIQRYIDVDVTVELPKHQ